MGGTKKRAPGGLNRLQVVEHRKEDLAEGLLLVGLPSQGFVGSVAVNYVIEQLKLRVFAGLYGAPLPPTVIAHHGVAQSPIRFFTGAARCGPDGKCDKLVAAVGDVPLPPEALNEAAEVILSWAKKRGISMVVVLEGIEAQTDLPKAVQAAVFGLRSAASKHALSRYKIEPVTEGTISSHAAAMLLAGNRLGMDVIALFTAARPDLPDGVASSKLLRRVDPMLPRIDLEPEALEARAREIESTLRDSLKGTQQQLRTMRKTSSMMYH